jgi:hypothetical protein
MSALEIRRMIAEETGGWISLLDDPDFPVIWP